MRNFQIKPHIADTRLEIKADSMAELFKAALLGMNQILKKNLNINDYPNLLKEQIKIDSNDKTTLLIDFLSEILTLAQIKKAIFSDIEIKKLTEDHITATIKGVKTESFDEDIKAVSYHEAQISKNKKGQYQTTIIFDI